MSENEISQSTDKSIPQTVIVRKKPFPWWLAIPFSTALLIIIMSVLALTQVGPTITIQFPDGHGIKLGDTLRYHGINVGDVIGADLSSDGKSVIISVQLKQDAEFLAKKDSRFWIVRPNLSLSGLSGADTIIGARYLSVAPGDGQAEHQFIGLANEPPIIEREPNGLEIICQAQMRSGLQSGAPVLYRQFVVGRVISIDLSSDASAVEARLYIQADYRSLIRQNCVFWNVSGFSLSGGIIGGLSLNVDSVESLVSGGIAFAIPNDPGKQAENGARFRLFPKVDDDWLDWNPSIEVLKQNTRIRLSDIPNIINISSHWVESGFWGTKKQQRKGYAIYTSKGLISLQSIVPSNNQAIDIHLNEQDYQVTVPRWQDNDFVLWPLEISHIPWPLLQMRNCEFPEDAYVVLDSETTVHLPIARFVTEKQYWLCEQKNGLSKLWHGAPVLAKSDKRLIGFLSAQDDLIKVLPLNAELLKQLE